LSKPYQILFPQEVDGRRDQNESGDETRIFKADLEADPATHAAADQNDPTVCILTSGDLGSML
jgi:hypothetical protein